MQLPEQILSYYDVDVFGPAVKFGSGLINSTWLVKGRKNDYILQQVNQRVFKRPGQIACNINALSHYINEKSPSYQLATPLLSKQQQPFVETPEGFFRLFVFVPSSHTVTVAQNRTQAFEAALQFGLFTKTFSKFSIDLLQITLPGFHDLSARYQQFQTALQSGNPTRIRQAKHDINFIERYQGIETTFQHICTSDTFKKRVTHHDTKISNVLFNEDHKGICVIDLDTVMPGYFISDVGDMMRTYLSAVGEEETELQSIEVRTEFFRAITEGYLYYMHDELSPAEIEHFFYSGLFMIYMQALRFLTDHLNNDVYYGAAYDGHNLARAQNQLTLLERYLENEALFRNIIDETIERYR